MSRSQEKVSPAAPIRCKQFLCIGGDDEPALVPGPPRRPLLSDAVALPLPEPREDLDASGRELDGEWGVLVPRG